MITKSIQYQRGLSLVELMIAIVLGLLISAAAIQLFLVSKQSFRLVDKNSNIQENHRFAVENLERNVRMAGFIEDMEAVKYENRTEIMFPAWSDWTLAQTLKGTGVTLSMRLRADGETVSLCNDNSALVAKGDYVDVQFSFSAVDKTLTCSASKRDSAGSTLTQKSYVIAEDIQSLSFQYVKGTNIVLPAAVNWFDLDAIKVNMEFAGDDGNSVKFVDLIELPNVGLGI